MNITLYEAIVYEVHSSWWTGYVPTKQLRSLAGTYFAWKARRKWNRFKKSMEERKRTLGY